jgi:hypothetical protein
VPRPVLEGLIQHAAAAYAAAPLQGRLLPQGRMLIERACDYIMGCCQSVSGAGRELGAWRCWQGGWKTLRTSKVGVMAPELEAYDFASDEFARAYLDMPVTSRGDVPRKGAPRRVPEDYATIQDALDAAQPGDVSIRRAAAPTHFPADTPLRRPAATAARARSPSPAHVLVLFPLTALTAGGARGERALQGGAGGKKTRHDLWGMCSPSPLRM